MNIMGKNKIRSYCLILVGGVLLSAGSYRAIAAYITCSYCTPTSISICDRDDYSPAGTATCLGRPAGTCGMYACNRCSGQFYNLHRVCVAFPVESKWCTLNGYTIDCGDKWKRVCEEGDDDECHCPDSGGDEDGICQFMMCNS
jgi:hypothetical protein